MQIKAYLDGILDTLAANPHVEAQSISFEERPPDAFIITGIVAFIDGSKLHIKEFLVLKPAHAAILKYGYHYVSSKGELIFRYDNALDPKARGLSTYPEHKHTPDGLKETRRPSWQDMFREISSSIGQHIKK